MTRQMTQNWLSDRLRTLKKDKKGLAEFLGMNQQHVNNLASGKSLTPERLTKLAEYLETDVLSLLNFFSSDNKYGKQPQFIEKQTETIPVIGYVQAGLWQEASQWDQSDFKPIYMPTDERFKGKRIYALEIRGNSMNLIYPPGSCVVCVSAEDYYEVVGEISSGKKVIVRRVNPMDGSVEATVKQYVKNEYGTFLMPHSTDTSFTPIKVDDGSCGDTKITGVVIGAFRKE